MKIRNYSSQDFEKCIQLFIEVFNNEPWNDKWSRVKAESYLHDYIHTPGFKGVVAEQDEVTYGFIFGVSKRWWSADEFFINEMCVKSSQQRSGIGTSMLNYLAEELKSEGIENMTLLTNRDIPAEQFYKKMDLKKLRESYFYPRNISPSVIKKE